MRTIAMLLMLSACGTAQDYVRPWIVSPPKRAAGTLDSPFLLAVETPQETPQTPRQSRGRVTLPELLRQPAGFPIPLVLTPCTSFPGNPVFIIEGDKITMRKLDR